MSSVWAVTGLARWTKAPPPGTRPRTPSTGLAPGTLFPEFHTHIGFLIFLCLVSHPGSICHGDPIAPGIPGMHKPLHHHKVSIHKGVWQHQWKFLIIALVITKQRYISNSFICEYL